MQSDITSQRISFDHWTLKTQLPTTLPYFGKLNIVIFFSSSDKFRELVGTAMDGVLFIDEAYDLDPAGDYKGKPIVSELLVSTVGIRILLNVFGIRVVDFSPNIMVPFGETI